MVPVISKVEGDASHGSHRVVAPMSWYQLVSSVVRGTSHQLLTQRWKWVGSGADFLTCCPSLLENLALLLILNKKGLLVILLALELLVDLC